MNRQLPKSRHIGTAIIIGAKTMGHGMVCRRGLIGSLGSTNDVSRSGRRSRGGRLKSMPSTSSLGPASASGIQTRCHCSSDSPIRRSAPSGQATSPNSSSGSSSVGTPLRRARAARFHGLAVGLAVPALVLLAALALAPGQRLHREELDGGGVLLVVLGVRRGRVPPVQEYGAVALDDLDLGIGGHPDDEGIGRQEQVGQGHAGRPVADLVLADPEPVDPARAGSGDDPHLHDPARQRGVVPVGLVEGDHRPRLHVCGAEAVVVLDRLSVDPDRDLLRETRVHLTVGRVEEPRQQLHHLGLRVGVDEDVAPHTGRAVHDAEAESHRESFRPPEQAAPS